MGTNYYWHEKPACKECGRPHKGLHIGKSSYGWVFTMRVHPDEGIEKLDDWIERWNRPGSEIFDEYNDKVSPVEMLAVVTIRARPDRITWSADEIRRNTAIADHETNLLRHDPARDPMFYGRGAGTYDYFDGEFC